MGNTFSNLKHSRGIFKDWTSALQEAFLRFGLMFPKGTYCLPSPRALTCQLWASFPPVFLFLERLAFPDSCHVAQIWGPDVLPLLLGSGPGERGEWRSVPERGWMRTGAQFAGSPARCHKMNAETIMERREPNQVPLAGLLGPEWRGSIRWKPCTSPSSQLTRDKDV